MPTPKQMEKLAAKAAKAANPAAAPDAPLPAEYWESVLRDPRSADDARMRQRKLSEVQRHVLRIFCRRCERIVEIQTADAATRSGRASRNGSWTTPASNALGDTKKTVAGRASTRLSRRPLAGPISLRLDV